MEGRFGHPRSLKCLTPENTYKTLTCKLKLQTIFFFFLMYFKKKTGPWKFYFFLCPLLQIHGAFLVAQLTKNPPAIQETWVPSLGQEDPLERGKATHSQYSGLENSMDCKVHGVRKSWKGLNDSLH